MNGAQRSGERTGVSPNSTTRVPGNNRQTVVLWRGPHGGGAISIAATFDIEAAFALVARIADVMTDEIRAEVEWLALPNATMRAAQWPE